jgi:AcrR family transcriptional regulator
MSAEGRRQQLVEIGLQLLETRPIHDLTLDEVATIAGVSRTLVFHYFPSKTDFISAVVATAGRRLVAASPQVPEADVDTRLRAMVSAFLRFVARKRGTYLALVRGAPGVDPVVMGELERARAALVGLWLEAAEWPHSDDITQLAVRGWLGALEEVALVAAAGTEVPGPVVIEVLVRGLLADLEIAAQLAPDRLGSGAPDA